jgi:hypothetical protein
MAVCPPPFGYIWFDDALDRVGRAREGWSGEELPALVAFAAMAKAHLATLDAAMECCAETGQEVRVRVPEASPEYNAALRRYGTAFRWLCRRCGYDTKLSKVLDRNFAPHPIPATNWIGPNMPDGVDARGFTTIIVDGIFVPGVVAVHAARLTAALIDADKRPQLARAVFYLAEHYPDGRFPRKLGVKGIAAACGVHERTMNRALTILRALPD